MSDDLRIRKQAPNSLFHPMPVPQRKVPKVEWPPNDPVDETPEEKVNRLELEREAKRVSDAIDHDIAVERELKRRNPGPTAKVLLLGQSESGKSTILKNMQLHFAPKAFRAEAESWRAIVHLNLIRSINFILDILDARNNRPGTAGSSSGSSTSSNQQPSYVNTRILSDDLRRLCIRLLPLGKVEESLTKRVAGHGSEELFSPTKQRYHPAKASEISVRPGSAWKTLLRFKRQSDSNPTTKNYDHAEDLQNRRILSACADDIAKLWAHQEAQDILAEKEIWLHDQPGFFLDDTIRICEEDYIPTPEDILRARVRTIGPEEHRITMESERGKEWLVYDVGGSRSQRAAWAQFFEDVTAIIFLAPASSFNQTLVEDPFVNRLSDTINLWKMISSNRLLANVDLILFLNKVDILDMQLQSGIKFCKYVTSYSKDKPNTSREVTKYLFAVFNKIHSQYTPKPRRIYHHLTCATDMKATASVIIQIKEVILVKALQHTNIL